MADRRYSVGAAPASTKEHGWHLHSLLRFCDLGASPEVRRDINDQCFASRIADMAAPV